MASLAMMIALVAVAGCMVVLMFGFSSVHGSLDSLQTSFDHQGSDLRQLMNSHSVLDRELQGLRQETDASTQTLTQQSRVIKRLEEASRLESSEVKSTASLLDELRGAVHTLRAQQDIVAKSLEELKAHQQGMEMNVTDAQGALEDLRGTSSQQLVWHDQMQAWRNQMQKFEWETGATLKQLTNQLDGLAKSIPTRRFPSIASANSGGFSGENFSSQPSMEVASTDESTASVQGKSDKTTRSSRRNSTAPLQGGGMTPRHDATTRGLTESPRLAHLALPLIDSTKRGSSTAADKGGASSAFHVLDPATTKPLQGDGHTTLDSKQHPPAISTPASSKHGGTSHHAMALLASADAPSVESSEVPLHSRLSQPAEPDTKSVGSLAEGVDKAPNNEEDNGEDNELEVLSLEDSMVPGAAGARLRISWYRECGCTGMEIEAVTILEGLVRALGAAQVRTNYCADSCTWPSSTRGVLEDIQLHYNKEKDLAKWLWTDEASSLSGVVVFVVHAAFLGVCGLPEFANSLADAGDPAMMAVRNGRLGLLRVSRSMLETDRLDPSDVERCNSQFDSVWVPSDFNRRTFSDSGVNINLLKVLPEAIDPRLFNCSAGSLPTRPSVPHFDLERLDEFVGEGVGHDVFTFLSIFKWEERKNWRTLLETFWQTFPHRLTEVRLEDGQTTNIIVRLLIKTQFLSWGTDPDEDVMQLNSQLEVSPADAKGRLLVIKTSLPLALVPGLYRSADAFVLPSHGEGWGLPLMEAMASGLPTIATGWGGSTEFMHAGNSLPLSYQLVDTPSGAFGHKWADPERPALRQAMENVVRRSATAQSIAKRACDEVPGELYTPDAVAHRIVAELSQVGSGTVFA